MARQIKVGTTDVSVVIRIVDSGDGTPETGVTSATGGLDLEYRREGAVSTDITEADLTNLNDAHSDGGMKHIGNGYYRLDLPDAACASGATGVLVHGTATGMVVIGEYIELVAYDPYDTVRLGLTALPNAAADAAGGLPISDAGGLDLDAKIGALTFTVAGDVDVNVQTWGGTAIATPPAVNVTQISGDGTAADNLENAYDDTAGPVPWQGIVDQGTAQAAAAGTITLRAAAAFGDTTIVGSIVMVYGSTQGYWQTRGITAYDSGTKEAAVDSNWTVTPTGTITYKIYAAPPAPTTPPDVNVASISDDATAAATLELFVEALDQATGQLDSGSLAAGAITAAAIADGAIDAATFAADVDAEILSYLVDDATRIDASALNTASGTTIPAIVADTNELQTDWVDGGRLDLILDDILLDTGTTLQGELDGIQADTEDIQTKIGTPSNLGGSGATVGANLSYISQTQIPATQEMSLRMTSGTIGSTGNDTTHLHLTGTPYGDDEINDLLIRVRDVSAGEYHSRWIEDFDGTSKLATVATLPFTPEDATDTYMIFTVSRAVTAATVSDKTGYSITGTITTLDALDTAQDTQHSTTQTAVADVPTNAELATAIITGLTTALTEGYRGTGATGSVRDLLYELIAHMGESSISSTTKTLKKLDGSTTAKTYTLDDASTPTSITETT